MGTRGVTRADLIVGLIVVAVVAAIVAAIIPFYLLPLRPGPGNMTKSL